MGTFLCASGIIERDSNAVCEVIAAYVAAAGGSFEPSTGTTEAHNICIIQATPNTTTVLYPDDFTDWEDLSNFLSLQLSTPVFSFHIHDGDLWMFVAFNNGQQVAWFNPVPDYWGDISDEDRVKWAGDAHAVARLVPGVTADSIANYFRLWTDDALAIKRKAYDDDEFAIGNDWQLTDFMRRLGFVYPVNDFGKPTGVTYFLKNRRQRNRSNSVGSPKPTPESNEKLLKHSSKKPWWKIW